MFEAVEELIGEHADLEKQLADPAVHADQANARRLSKRYAELTPIISTYRSWRQAGDDVETARELGADDPDFAAEVKDLERGREELTERLRLLLVPRDPNDDKDVILEVAGEQRGLLTALARLHLQDDVLVVAGVARDQQQPKPLGDLLAGLFQLLHLGGELRVVGTEFAGGVDVVAGLPPCAVGRDDGGEFRIALVELAGIGLVGVHRGVGKLLFEVDVFADQFLDRLEHHVFLEE